MKWHVEWSSNPDGHFYSIYNADNGLICRLPMTKHNRSTAYLMAAAPELLEALESVMQDFLDGYASKFNAQQEITAKQVFAAINKAKGETK